MDVVLFGIQGSGKGTQAKKLAAEFGYNIFEAGGELRRIAASGTELGNTVKSYIDVGKLVPFEIIIKVLEEVVKARPADQRILFDGIPRDIDQKREFDRIMEECGRGFRCIEITVDRDKAVQRILGRAKEEGRRDDADEAAIKRRMALFHERTEPVIEEYRNAGKLIEVDGDGAIEEVYDRLCTAVGIQM